MQYKYPLLQLVPERLRNTLSRLKDQIWESESTLEAFIAPSSGQSVDMAPSLAYEKIKKGTYFASPDWTHKWFKLNIPEADEKEKGRRYLYWNVQGETTVYLSQKVFCGLDIAHPWCKIPDEAATLYLECGTYQTAIWTMAADDELTPVDDYGLRFHRASVRVRNEQTWNTFHDFDVLLQLMEYHLEKEGIGLLNKGLKANINSCTPFLRRLMRRLDEAVNTYDTKGPEEFEKELQKIYGSLPAEEWGMNMGIVGNSHIDLVWMWPKDITWKKAVHTLSTMLKLSDQYPEMVFTMSQPPLMENIKKSAPQIYAEIQQKMQSGQWEATGVMEVEADTLIPCGEGLVRSILVGQKRFNELFGTTGETLWLPDVFGYSQCIPQLCKLAGIKNFFTTKMTWSEVNKFPHNSFLWESLDGSSVLSHLANCGYVSPMSVEQAISNANDYRQSDVHNEMLLAIGHGDGGGGVTEGQCERVRRMKNLATAPKASWTQADRFFDRLRKVSNKLPVYRGEMYLEYHRGTYTVQSEFKRLYRSCEKALQTYEAACTMMNRVPDIESIWRRVLFAQFHDALPGSSIQKVYDEMNPELAELSDHLRNKTTELLENKNSKKIAFFNPLPIQHCKVTEIPLDLWTENFPSHSPTQQTETAALVLSDFRGIRTVPVSLTVEESSFVSVTPSLLDNGRLKAEFDKTGQLTHIEIDGGALGITAPCKLIVHEDHPANFQAWDIDRNALWLGKEYSGNLDLKVIEPGPLRAVLRGKGSLGDSSTFSIDYILEKDSAVLKVKLSVDWQEKEKLLRFIVPTGYKGREAIYGAPFGSVRRSQRANNSVGAAQWEVPGSRWMAVINDSGKGLGIVTEAKYGFNCLDGIAGISLLRAPRTPDNESIGKEEIFADQGTHEINFAITKHSPERSDFSTPHLAETLYSQPILCNVKQENEFVSFENLGTLVPSWIKPGKNEYNYVMRLHESLGDSGEATVVFHEAPSNVFLADLKEQESSRPVRIDDRTFKIAYRPYELITLVVVR